MGAGNKLDASAFRVADIYKTKVKYVATLGDQNIDFNNGYVSFDKIYDEDGAKIYKLSYN